MTGEARQAPKAASERIRGELLKLGIRVSKRTVQKYMHSQPIDPHRGQSWKTFLKNHSVWACDFLQLYDIWFRPIFAFFIVNVNTKEVVHVAVTRAPTEQWTAPQLPLRRRAPGTDSGRGQEVRAGLRPGCRWRRHRIPSPNDGSDQ